MSLEVLNLILAILFFCRILCKETEKGNLRSRRTVVFSFQLILALSPSLSLFKHRPRRQSPTQLFSGSFSDQATTISKSHRVANLPKRMRKREGQSSFHNNSALGTQNRGRKRSERVERGKAPTPEEDFLHGFILLRRMVTTRGFRRRCLSLQTKGGRKLMVVGPLSLTLLISLHTLRSFVIRF